MKLENNHEKMIAVIVLNLSVASDVRLHEVILTVR